VETSDVEEREERQPILRQRPPASRVGKTTKKKNKRLARMVELQDRLRTSTGKFKKENEFEVKVRFLCKQPGLNGLVARFTMNSFALFNEKDCDILETRSNVIYRPTLSRKIVDVPLEKCSYPLCPSPFKSSAKWKVIRPEMRSPAVSSSQFQGM
jgi:hypothetical protein